jgi:O-antigen ligase
MPITALGFLGIFVVGCLLTLKRPFIGLLLYFFVFYMHPPGKYWGAYLPEIRWTFIVAVLTLASLFFNEKEIGKWLSFPASKWLIAFGVLIVVQSPFVISFAWHKEYVILFIKMLILFFLMVTLINSKQRLIQTILMNLICAGYIGYTARQNHGGGRFEKAGLPSIEDSNLLAIHMIPIAIIGTLLFLTDHYGKKKYLLLLPLAFVGNLIIMTSSRGAIAGLLVAGCFIIVFAVNEFKTKLIKWGALGLLALSFLSLGFIIERFESITPAENGGVVEKSANSRIVIIEAQFEMFKSHFLLGGGHRTTLLLSRDYIPAEYLTKTAVGGVRGSHNLTMSILADHGILGALIFFTLIISCIRTGVKLSRDVSIDKNLRLISLGAASALVGLMVSSQFANSKVMEVTIWMVAFITILLNLANAAKLDSVKNSH